MAEVKTQGAVEAMEVAEASRETEWEKPSFVGDLFLGKLNLDLIHPFPEQPAADKAEADEFLAKMERFLAENVDAEEIDRKGEYDYELFKGFNELGAWGMKIPKEYGGLGFTVSIVHFGAFANGRYSGSPTSTSIQLVYLLLSQ